MTTILVVDDAPEIRDLVATFLTDEGFEVTSFGRAEDALARLQVFLPDGLILDGRLPGMSGWQCLNLLRGADRTTRLPVLMLTAAFDDLQRAARPPDDCTSYVAKPFDLDALLAALHRVIETCTQELVTI
jgi:DNA-binding response OmpR family regulator